MTDTAMHPTPAAGDVLREQLRAVGLALRGPALVAGGLFLVNSAILVWRLLVDDGMRYGVAPHHAGYAGIVGLLLPIAVWKGERIFGTAFLWTLPVDRLRHALAKVAAGWAWLMVGVSFNLLWDVGIALVAGGDATGEEMVRVGADVVPWTAPPVLWLVPFAAATATYLLSSALFLATPRRVGWLAGGAAGLILAAAAADTLGRALDSQWLIFLPSRTLRAFLYGDYGLARLEGAHTSFLPDAGYGDVSWPAPPDAGAWAVTAALWCGIGLLAVWAAASRHRERRRG